MQGIDAGLDLARQIDKERRIPAPVHTDQLPVDAYLAEAIRTVDVQHHRSGCFALRQLKITAVLAECAGIEPLRLIAGACRIERNAEIMRQIHPRLVLPDLAGNPGTRCIQMKQPTRIQRPLLHCFFPFFFPQPFLSGAGVWYNDGKAAPDFRRAATFLIPEENRL